MTFPAPATINNYGSGVLIDAVPLVDPTSEMPASALNNLRNDCASMTTQCPICIFQFVGSATAPSLVSTATWTAGINAGWGNNPLNNPSFTRTATGTVQVTMPTDVPDQIGGTNLVNIRGVVIKSMEASFNPHSASGVVNSSNQFTMYLGSGGSASDAAGVVFFVEIF